MSSATGTTTAGASYTAELKDLENPLDDAPNLERHADAFASDLILPNYLLLPRLRKLRRLTLALARDLGGEFGASLTATLIKTVQLNCFPLVIVCHDRTRIFYMECWYTIVLHDTSDEGAKYLIL